MLIFVLVVSAFVIGLSVNVSAQQSSTIPSWIKNTAKWWGEGRISDDEFIKALQWLIDQKILVIQSNQVLSKNNPASSQSVTSTQSQNAESLTEILPSWDDIGTQWEMKNNGSSYIDTKGRILGDCNGGLCFDTFTGDSEWQNTISPISGFLGGIERSYYKDYHTISIKAFSFQSNENALDVYNLEVSHVKQRGGYQETLFTSIDATCYGGQSTSSDVVSKILCYKNKIFFMVKCFSCDDLNDTEWIANIVAHKIQ